MGGLKATHLARIVTSTYRYKRPPQKRKATPQAGPSVVTQRASKQRTGSTVVTAAPPPANDDGKPAPKKSTIVTTTSRKRHISDGPPLPMELPLSRKPVERKGDWLKATGGRT